MEAKCANFHALCCRHTKPIDKVDTIVTVSVHELTTEAVDYQTPGVNKELDTIIKVLLTTIPQ